MTTEEKRYRLTFTQDGTIETRDVPESAVMRYCLEVSGGGYTAPQTAAAMLLFRRAIDTGRLSDHIDIEELPRLAR